MPSPAINTVIKMMECLPEDKQNELVEHLREQIQNLQAEQKWQESFDKSQDKLIAAAKSAKQQIAEGKATPMDYSNPKSFVRIFSAYMRAMRPKGYRYA